MGRNPVYTHVYNQLRYKILSGELPIGSLLPPERKLAVQLGVSRNTIVRAFSELEAEGLIAGKMGSGRYVEALPPTPSLTRVDWKSQSTRSLLHPSPSHMEEILSITDKYPHTINFAHGDGGKYTLVQSRLTEYVEAAAKRSSSYFFTSVQGLPELRERLVEWMGIPQISSPDQICVTSGSQEGLYLITTLLARQGDCIVTEMPTYFGSLQLFQSLGMQIIPVPLDQDGMRVDLLEGILARSRPRFIYTVPTFHNPTGRTLTLARRRQLLAISEKYGIPIVEDDAYRHLHLEHEPPPSLKQLDQWGNVIYLNTFSKILFPGLRIGWIAGSSPIIQYITRLRELTISTSTLSQFALAEYMRDRALRPHLDTVTRLYAEQARLMESQLRPLRSIGLDYEMPAGGFYFWISLPEGMKARQLMERCMEAGVSFTCGDMFLLREAEQPYIRLCFTHEGAEQIEHGMSILTHVLYQQKEDSR